MDIKDLMTAIAEAMQDNSSEISITTLLDKITDYTTCSEDNEIREWTTNYFDAVDILEDTYENSTSSQENEIKVWAMETFDLVEKEE